MILDEIYAPIQGELKLVEDELVARLASEEPAVAEMVRALLPLAGKRLRPALTLFSACLNGHLPAASHTIRLAAVMELMHTATLLHDDVIDQAQLRRLQPSLNAGWGNARAVLLGDFIYSRAFATLAEIGDVALIRLISQVAITMCEGELAQLASRFSTVRSEADYLEIIRRKTASLISACCEGGGLLAQAEPRLVAQLAAYGLRLGLAFQIVDDCLDLIGNQEVLGKDIGTDLASGKFTLPVIHLLQRCSPEERSKLLEAIQAGAANGWLDQIRDLARDTGAIQAAYTTATSFAHSAKQSLAGFQSSWRPHLLALADYVVERQS